MTYVQLHKFNIFFVPLLGHFLFTSSLPMRRQKATSEFPKPLFQIETKCEVLHLASFWKWEYVEPGNCLLALPWPVIVNLNMKYFYPLSIKNQATKHGRKQERRHTTCCGVIRFWRWLFNRWGVIFLSNSSCHFYYFFFLSDTWKSING